jgi:hypothetical protein
MEAKPGVDASAHRRRVKDTDVIAQLTGAAQRPHQPQPAGLSYLLNYSMMLS